MRRTTVFLICLLLTLPMLAGCTGNANGDGDADPTSDASTVIINNYYNNTTTAEVSAPIHYSAQGNISIKAGQVVEILHAWSITSVDGTDSENVYVTATCLGNKALVGNSMYYGKTIWLPTDGGSCTYTHATHIQLIYRVHSLTYEGLHITNSSNSSSISTFQYSAADHGANTPSSATDDTLFTLQFVQAPSDLSWANLTVQIIGADGNPTTCAIDAAAGNCNLKQFGSDNLTWEQSEIIHVQENGLAICSAAPCSFSVKISLDGMDLSGTSTVVAE